MRNLILALIGLLAVLVAGAFTTGCHTPARPSPFRNASLQKHPAKKSPAPPTAIKPTTTRAPWFSRITSFRKTQTKSAPRPAPSPNTTPALPVVVVPDDPSPNSPIKQQTTTPPPPDAARLRPGLVVNVSVLVAGKKEIEATNKRVTDSGTITVPLLETVNVNDLTLEELGNKLTTSYEEYFVNPQVIVEFVRDDNKEGLSPWGSVTVLGRVKKPGKIGIPATRDLTLSAAIQQAGGFDTSAKETALRVTHRLPDGTMRTREVNLHSVGAQGRVEDDILLEPDDVVFVPELVF